MRVTSNIMYEQLINDMQKSLEEMSQAQNSLSTGLRILKPSDDVVGLSKVMDYKLTINSNTQYMDNIGEAVSLLEMSEVTLDGTRGSLGRLQELAIMASTDTNDAASRLAIQEEVANIAKDIAGQANTNFRGRYLFSGFSTDTAAYDTATGFVADQSLMEVRTGPGTSDKIAVNVSNGDAFTWGLNGTKILTNGDGSSTTYTQGAGTTIMVDIVKSDGSTDSFSFDDVVDMTNQFATALQNNDADRIRALLEPIEQTLNGTVNTISNVGSRLNTLDAQKGRLVEQNFSLEKNRSNVEDADLTKVISDIARSDLALQALRSSAARILSTSLMDFLR